MWPHGSTPGFPALYYPLEFALTYVHWVSDGIKPSHPLLPPCPSGLNLSQHQSLFQWVGSFASGGQSIGASASVLPMNIQGWFPLELTGLICLLSRGLLRVFSSTTLQKHQFFGAQPSFGPTLISVRDCELIAWASVGLPKKWTVVMVNSTQLNITVWKRN